jgi:hypothetical protein
VTRAAATISGRWACRGDHFSRNRVTVAVFRAEGAHFADWIPRVETEVGPVPDVDLSDRLLEHDGMFARRCAQRPGGGVRGGRQKQARR